MLRDRFEPTWVKAMIGILALVVASAAVLVFIWVVPSSESSETYSTTDGSDEIIAQNNDVPVEPGPLKNDGEGATEEIPDEPEQASEGGIVEDGTTEESPTEEGPDIIIELPPPEEDPSPRSWIPYTPPPHAGSHAPAPVHSPASRRSPASPTPGA